MRSKNERVELEMKILRYRNWPDSTRPMPIEPCPRRHAKLSGAAGSWPRTWRPSSRKAAKEAAGRALAIEQDWLNGEIVQNARVSAASEFCRPIAAVTIDSGTKLRPHCRLITLSLCCGHIVVIVRKAQQPGFNERSASSGATAERALYLCNRSSMYALTKEDMPLSPFDAIS